MSKESESLPACKVIVFCRSEAGIRFGLMREEGSTGLPAMPLPDLLEIDLSLIRFGLETLGLHDPKVHARFVERPHPRGWLFYLVEERPVAGLPAPGVAWVPVAEALERLSQEERKAVARAVRYLSAP